jgi:hypothetical protein
MAPPLISRHPSLYCVFGKKHRGNTCVGIPNIIQKLPLAGHAQFPLQGTTAKRADTHSRLAVADTSVKKRWEFDTANPPILTADAIRPFVASKV